MNRIALLLLAAVLIGCGPPEEREPDHDEVSLYSEHEGLTLPEDMQRELGLQLMSVTDTNAIPESAIIRGAKEDFGYVKKGPHFQRTLLNDISLGHELVTHGVKDLWMIELLAIRGGEPCCPAH
jgi:hypothetical protein